MNKSEYYALEYTYIHRPEYKQYTHYPKEEDLAKKICSESTAAYKVRKEDCYINLPNPEQCPRCSSDLTTASEITNCPTQTHSYRDKVHAVKWARHYFCNNCESSYLVAELTGLEPLDYGYRCPQCGSTKIGQETYGAGPLYQGWVEGVGSSLMDDGFVTVWYCKNCKTVVHRYEKAGGPLK